MVIPSQALSDFGEDGVETKSGRRKEPVMKAQISTVSYKRSLIIGMLLGNAHSRQWKNGSGQLKARFTVSSGLRYSDLTKWKADELSRLFDTNLAVKKGKASDRIQFSITRGKRIRVISRWFYRNGGKVVSDKIRFMDHPVGMAMLICDKGTVKTREKKHESGIGYYSAPKLFVRTDSFSHDDIERLLNHIGTLCGAEGLVETKTGRLCFDNKNSHVLWNYAGQWIPPVKSMSEKFSFMIERYGTGQSDTNSRHLSSA